MRSTLLALLSITLLAGCLSGGDPVPTVYYRIDPTAELETKSPLPDGPSIAVRPLRATAPRATGITYVDIDRSEHIYPSVSWSEPPELTLTRALVANLLALGTFSDVGIAGDTEIPDWIVQGEILAFHERRSPEGSVAVCALKLEVRERATGTLALFETFTEETPFQAGSVPGLAEALEQSAAKALAAAAAAIN